MTLNGARLPQVMDNRRGGVGARQYRMTTDIARTTCDENFWFCVGHNDSFPQTVWL